MKKISCAFVIAAFLSIPLALFADGGNESFMSIGVESKDQKSFTVEKRVFDNENKTAIEKKFMAQRIDYTYTVKLINGDKDDESVLKTYTGKGAILSGKKSAAIPADPWIKELAEKINRRGSIEIAVPTVAAAGFDSMWNSCSIDVMNPKYRDEVVNTATNNPKLMENFASDYQNFMMQNSGKDQKEINKEFIKKYPQYKTFLPEQ